MMVGVCNYKDASRVLVGGLLVLVTLICVDTATTQSNGFEQTLNALIQQSVRGFRPLRGALDPDGDGEAWNAKVILPGAVECTVWIYKDPSEGEYYDCVFERNTDLAAIEAHYDQLVERVARCLPGWSSTEQQSRSYTRKGKKFKKEGNSPAVRVQVVGSGAHPYRLELDIDPPDKD